MPDVPVTLVFSPTGFGKTIDHVCACPSALVICSEGALLSVTTTLGYTPPAIKTAKTFFDVITILGNASLIAPYPALVLDDITLLGKATEVLLSQQHKGQSMWSPFIAVALQLLEAVRACGKPVFMNGHMRAARTNNAGKYIRGGVDLPCDMTEAWTSRCDASFRALRITDGPDSDDKIPVPLHGHALKYWSRYADDTWAVRNRIGAPEDAPMNLGELLRAAGLFVPVYPPILAWMPGAIAKAAELLSQVGPESDARRAVLREAQSKMLAKGRPSAHVRWALRCAEDRNTIRLLSQYEEQSRYAEVKSAS